MRNFKFTLHFFIKSCLGRKKESAKRKKKKEKKSKDKGKRYWDKSNLGKGYQGMQE